MKIIRIESDGVDWRWVNCHHPVPWGPRSLHSTFVFQQRIWVLGGQMTPQFAPEEEIFYDDVWNTEDGLHWDRVLDTARTQRSLRTLCR